MPLGKLDVAPAVCLLRSRRSDRQDLTVAGWRRLLLSRRRGTQARTAALAVRRPIGEVRVGRTGSVLGTVWA